jgi:uncharacterized protein
VDLVLDRISAELKLPRERVAAVAALLEAKNTVPFIARYRKEMTGSLDEVAIRAIEDRAAYYKELLDRRGTVLKSVSEQGKLSDELKARIENAWVKAELEDLYLPYKPKKRTKAIMAKERGLEPLLEALLQDESDADPLILAEAFVKDGQEGLETPSACVEGAGHILAEMVAENAEVRQRLRQVFHDTGILHSLLREDKLGSQESLRFKPYFDFKEAIAKMPSHRLLALRRGEKEDVLTVKLRVDREKLVPELTTRIPVHPQSGYRRFLHGVAEDAFDRLLAPSIEVDVRVEAKRKADGEAIKVFQTNLDNLLLSPPAGQVCTLGVDPGIRTGCKLAVINRLGQFMDAAAIFPLEPKRDLDGAKAILEKFFTTFPIESVAVGNGTGGRESEAFLRDWLSETGRLGVVCVPVSEAGASVYSASDIAREEFPEQDVTVRGAISIARRFQDPLAELVKVEPKSIGVGQYQHDVNQTALKKSLDNVVESCVNRVGVDLNSASYRLLSYVAGIGEALAKNIVQHRFEHGAFKRRGQLMEIPRFGERAFQQAAGFLRIRDGEDPLDTSAVHPESYPVVERICAAKGLTLNELIGNSAVLDELEAAAFVDEQFGVETVKDIIAELRKPGRDPRRRFEPIQFKEGVHKPDDLAVGMELQGIVTNVTDFGAFVDVGVHQDGLVHLSEISHRFVKNPSSVLSVGQVVKVKVLALDLPAKRIALSIKAMLQEPAAKPKPEKVVRAERPPKREGGAKGRPSSPSRPEPARKEPRPQPVRHSTLEDLISKFGKGPR